jgi:hypothetical protein
MPSQITALEEYAALPVFVHGIFPQRELQRHLIMQLFDCLWLALSLLFVMK